MSLIAKSNYGAFVYHVDFTTFTTDTGVRSTLGSNRNCPRTTCRLASTAVLNCTAVAAATADTLGKNSMTSVATGYYQRAVVVTITSENIMNHYVAARITISSGTPDS